ncbi:hypothetical protein [Azospirillum brasilense]|uniref:hypothetical protein n=1 Tax=Azospirillum brasilense TaxID=192 RepID=UPI001EDC2912|nr:hypothetical protein [Azospirillum brasilense]UKJ74249.1 hypothetical protein H1Q64_06600 [Azospirillum brasilense]
MTGGFALTDHACRFCLSRVLESAGTFLCATCGAESAGRPDPICGCGVVNRETGKRLLRCALNPTPTPTNPALVVIVTAGAASF